MKKQHARFQVIKPGERRALRDTGTTARVRNLARDCDMAFGRFEALREAEMRIKAEADAAWKHANALMGKLIKATAAEEARNAAKATRTAARR